MAALLLYLILHTSLSFSSPSMTLTGATLTKLNVSKHFPPWSLLLEPPPGASSCARVTVAAPSS